MIAQIRGTLVDKGPESVIVDVAGLGYEVFVPAGVLLNIGLIGDSIFLKTHLDVKEDSMTLYGFSSSEQLDMFRLLISVSKIGPRTGLNILSVMDVDTIVRSVHDENVSSFTAVSGIGSKTGKRIILELAEKVAKRWIGSQSEAAVKSADSSPVWGLARNALQAQGFSDSEIGERLAAARKVLKAEPSIQDVLSQALRYVPR